MGAAPSVTCIDLAEDGDDSAPAGALPVQDEQQHDVGITLQQETGTNRLPTTAGMSLGSFRQVTSAENQQVTCRLLTTPLASQKRKPSSANLPEPHMSADEAQSCLLDHVVLKDILRVLGDTQSRTFSAPEPYASLQLQYLQRIPDPQAENQGRLLVYLEWLTEQLLQDALTAKHEMLYTVAFKVCKASEVALHLPSDHVASCTCCAQMLFWTRCEHQLNSNRTSVTTNLRPGNSTSKCQSCLQVKSCMTMREFMVNICKIVPKYMPEFTQTVRARGVRNEVRILISVFSAL